MSHSLVEIPRSNWIKLLNLYGSQRDKSGGYQTIQNYMIWTQKNPELSVKIYSLDGDWETDGLYILEDNTNSYPYIYFNTLECENYKRLDEAIHCITNHEQYLLMGIQERFQPMIEKFFAEGNLSFVPAHCVWFKLQHEQTLSFSAEAPAGHHLAPLKLCNATQINNLWPHRAPGSVVFVESLITYNDSIGLFKDNGELVAWCLRLPSGALGLLQVEEQYKRKGFGNLVVRAMSKKIGSQHLDVMAPVVENNVASRTLFNNLGFEIVDKVFWALKVPQ